jgi:DNA-binding transcriptional regulator YiaG
MKKQGTPDKLHYTGCGLDYIYLLNGFDLFEDEDGDVSYAIHDAAQLHEAIAYAIVTETPELRGMELRFFRSLLHLSQENMAKGLFRTRDAVAKYESKPKDRLPDQTEALLRCLVMGHLKKDTTIGRMLKILQSVDDSQESEILLKKTNDHWIPQAA